MATKHDPARRRRVVDYDRDERLIRHLCQGTIDRRLAAELQGLATAIVYDDYVSDEEVGMLSLWLSTHAGDLLAWPLNELADLLERVLADGRIDDPERSELLTFLSGIAASLSQSGAPAENIFDVDPRIVFAARAFAITGKLHSGPRKQARRAIESRGGLFHGGPRVDTDYLVVGDLGSDSWITSRYGTKIERVMQYRSTGAASTLIVRESDFVRATLATVAAVA